MNKVPKTTCEEKILQCSNVFLLCCTSSHVFRALKPCTFIPCTHAEIFLWQITKPKLPSRSFIFFSVMFLYFYPVNVMETIHIRKMSVCINKTLSFCLPMARYIVLIRLKYDTLFFIHGSSWPRTINSKYTLMELIIIELIFGLDFAKFNSREMKNYSYLVICEIFFPS